MKTVPHWRVFSILYYFIVKFVYKMSDSDSGKECSALSYKPQTRYHHPKLIDNDGNTRLHYAAAKDDVAGIVLYLDKESPIVDPQNYLGWTPLMMACRHGHFETVKCLLNYRANATKRNRFGMNVFQIAIASGNLDMVDFLLEHLLAGGISRRILEHTFSVVSLAVLFRQQQILEFLIMKHFIINNATIQTGITPFMFAHALENDSAISTLLKHKVDTKLKNCLGHTAVDIATIRHQMKVVHTNDHRILAQKLAAANQQESIQNELQNQQLRNVLQLKPENINSPNVFSSQQLCSPHQPQVPYIILTPYPNNGRMNFIPMPNQMIPAHTRKSSNISPFPVPPPPNVSPVTPASVGPMGAHHIFFPPDFSPSNFPVTMSQLHISPQAYASNEFLNAGFTSTTDMIMSPSVMNFMSPCM